MKISRELEARLAARRPSEKVHLVLVLKTDDAQGTSHRRSRAERQALVETTRKSAAGALAHVDPILARFGGKRLAGEPTALGTIPVEITVAGVRELAASEYVKAILEDQPVARR